MSAQTMTVETTTVFELIRWVDGRPTAYVPYGSNCAGCCAAPEATQPARRSCCGGS